MKLRETSLPPGWYPGNPRDISSFIEGFLKDGSISKEGRARAVLSPHAGWYYSGYTAACSVAALDRSAETVAVIGGHLPAGAPFLFAAEDAVNTPLGPMTIDRELRERLANKLPAQEDRYRDNTVEVLLPMVRYFFPKAQLLWARFPADSSAFGAGKILAACAEELGRRVVVAGSSDLTHYGSNYGFSPKGKGKPALDWVRQTNDANFIKAVLSGDPDEVLNRAENDFSSCSAGAVLGAMGFVPPGTGAELLDYRTSADASNGIPDSFVGYASIVLKSD